LGIALDPMDIKADPDVYFNSNDFFAKGKFSTSGAGISGKIKMASGPILEQVTTIVSGLPVSDHDHGLNAMVFGNNGELYFTLGSNTNAGVPGPLSSTSELKENFLSAAINVAYLSHPNFDGAITWTAPDDGNMIARGVDIFAPGLRNPFGLEFHSNGKLYCTDNGPNVNYGPFSTGCGDNEFIPEFNDIDEFNWIQKGKYYGSPNKKRADFFNDPRQCKWWSGKASSNADLEGALVTSYASRVGLMEYRSDHFAGQLRGNMISVQFNVDNGFSRLILNEDGTDVVPQSYKFIPLDIGTGALDVTQAPNGNLIDFRYESNFVTYYAPVDAPKTIPVVNTVWPYRGPASGGNMLSIYGQNFGSVIADAAANVGGVACPIVSVTPVLIECLLPGGMGTVDVKVTIVNTVATYEKGYQYITGLPPPGFVLPIYDGIKP
jgi:glucose/arabinose dehydrogenase